MCSNLQDTKTWLSKKGQYFAFARNTFYYVLPLPSEEHTPWIKYCTARSHLYKFVFPPTPHTAYVCVFDRINLLFANHTFKSSINNHELQNVSPKDRHVLVIAFQMKYRCVVMIAFQKLAMIVQWSWPSSSTVVTRRYLFLWVSCYPGPGAKTRHTEEAIIDQHRKMILRTTWTVVGL